MKNKVTVNMMVKNEPVAAHGILSVINHVDHVIITDTGSTDETFSELESLKKKYKEKIDLRQEIIGDGHNWSITKGHVDSSGVPDHVAKALGDIRRKMHSDTDTAFTFVCDGDEIYPDELIQYIKYLVRHDLFGNVAAFVPFVDFIDDVKHVRQYHWMGRVFRTDMTECRGQYPAEMHYNKLTNECLELYSPNIYKVPEQYGRVAHFECLIKKNRKDHVIIDTYNSLPESIERNKVKYPRINKYLELQ